MLYLLFKSSSHPLVPSKESDFKPSDKSQHSPAWTFCWSLSFSLTWAHDTRMFVWRRESAGFTPHFAWGHSTDCMRSKSWILWWINKTLPGGGEGSWESLTVSIKLLKKGFWFKRWSSTIDEIRCLRFCKVSLLKCLWYLIVFSEM